MVTRELAPMEMRSADTIPDGPDWQYEPKWDGFRCWRIACDDVALISKNARWRATRDCRRRRSAGRPFSLDGELVVPSAGALSFDTSSSAFIRLPARCDAGAAPALYLVFDALASRASTSSRRRLASGVPRSNSLRRSLTRAAAWLSPATTDRGVVNGWFARVGGALDGVVAKRRSAAYASGRRDAAVKVKKRRTADCVVGGFRFATGSTDRVGSLLLGLYDEEGLLDYIGFASAFDAAERRALVRRLQPHAGGAGFSGGAPGDAPSRWQRDAERDRSYVR